MGPLRFGEIKGFKECGAYLGLIGLPCAEYELNERSNRKFYLEESGGMFPQKILKFRSSEITGNTSSSTHPEKIFSNFYQY